MLSKIQLIAVLISLTVLWNHINANKKVCRLKAEKGPCTGYILRWYFNKKTKDCTTFVYGGCGGNANRFDTEEECIAKCGCRLPAKVGPCEAHIKMWFYKNTSKMCEIFYYGGCQGNANRFDTKRECKKVCDRCYQPKEKGPCKGRFVRYYYDYEKEKCKKFIYGGCKGNANNFKTKERCEKACYKPDE